MFRSVLEKHRAQSRKGVPGRWCAEHNCYHQQASETIIGFLSTLLKGGDETVYSCEACGAAGLRRSVRFPSFLLNCVTIALCFLIPPPVSLFAVAWILLRWFTPYHVWECPTCRWETSKLRGTWARMLPSFWGFVAIAAAFVLLTGQILSQLGYPPLDLTPTRKELVAPKKGR